MKNKRRLLGSTGLVVVFLMIVFLITPNFVLSLITADINLEGENFNGIHLNENISKLNPDSISKDTLNPNFYYLSNGVRVITDENKNIKNIAITHDTDINIKTSRGISVGAPLENVIESYGEDYYKRREQGVEIMVYVDKNKFLEFWYWDHEVQEIRLGYNRIN
ncbi:hypothetical protein JOD29_003077 [Lysinibacillus composti]|uniref:Uncharacterized protein n=1 Tax=Lysinibacillus composti TaxID=720633 RepID=A0A3N9UAY4_9BACI|nr:hypothetical protein [Lysinibacillus composti]MBM7609801.1 hypothetical protein [Lysinibacillus composti]RQW73575.1 hypothetical protein EBB45_15830 [Lysinibacillus composti]